MPKSKPNSNAPAKPWPDFPLFPHASGRWAKKIRGNLAYFGRWGHKVGGTVEPVADVRKSAEDALSLYETQRDDLHRGLTPRVSTGQIDTRSLCNQFLAAKRAQVDAGEMKERTWFDYYRSAERLVDALGRTTPVDALRPEDFQKHRERLAAKLGPVPLSNEIQRVRTIFKWGYESRLLAQPMVYGPDFRKPTRATMRKARHAKGKRMLEAAELRTVLQFADVQARAWSLLAINCGFGNTDVAELPLAAVDLDNAFIDYPRPKTGIARRCPLWPETVDALRAALAERHEPKDADARGLFFVSRFGRRLVREELTTDAAGKPKRYNSDGVGLMFGRLLRDCGLKRPGVAFYSLRHAFSTVAEETRDFPAVERIMGHEQGGNIATMYREHVGDDRLRAVVEHVRAWLAWEPVKASRDVVATIGPEAKRTRQTGGKRRRRAS